MLHSQSDILRLPVQSEWIISVRLNESFQSEMELQYYDSELQFEAEDLQLMIQIANFCV